MNARVCPLCGVRLEIRFGRCMSKYRWWHPSVEPECRNTWGKALWFSTWADADAATELFKPEGAR